MFYHLLWTIFTVLAILDLTSKNIDEHNWKLYLILAALYAIASRIDKNAKVVEENLNFKDVRFIIEACNNEKDGNVDEREQN